MKEYVIYSRRFIHKKRELPDIEYTYFSGSEWQPDYTKDIKEATLFYDKEEVIRLADLFLMEPGEITIRVERIK